MTVAERKMPESARRLVALARFDPLIFLYYGVLWVGGAASLATVIARRALGEVEGSAVLAAAVSHHSLIFAALFTPVALILVGATGVRSAYNTSKDIKEPPKTLRQVAQMMLKDPVIVGALVIVILVFLPLIRHDDLVVGLLAVERSQREHVRSVLRDVGSLGIGAVVCFIMLPTTVLRQWRMK